MSSPFAFGVVVSGGDFGDERLEHWFPDQPFDPHVAEALTLEQERIYMASQWRMMWLRSQTDWPPSPALSWPHHFSVPISEFIAPYNMHTRHTDHIFCATAIGEPYFTMAASARPSPTS